MRRGRYSEEKTVEMLVEHHAGVSAPKLCIKYSRCAS
jgi:hypothetical protein